MSESTKVFVAVDSGLNSDAIESVLPIASEIQVTGVVDGLEESWSTLQETLADVLVVACAGYSERALFFIDGAAKQQPERPVVVLCDGSPNGFVRRVFEAGADDIVTLPAASDEIAFVLEKAIARRHGATATTSVALAPLVCVLGPKGGTGKTLTAANLGVALAEQARKTVIVDLDLQFGDVGLALGLAPERTIYDLAKSGGSLDAEKIEAYMGRHGSGVRVLMAPTRPDHAGAVAVEFLREVYATLRATNDYVIVDTPPGFTPEVIASIDSSSHVCMVGMLDALSLKNTKLGLETLELMGYQSDRVRVLLNRADTRVGITPEDVVAVLGREPDVLVPSDRDVPRSVNEAAPIVLTKPKSDAARAFRSLADSYTARVAESNGGGRRLLSRRKG
jgi:pilus assembly protein CpaE